MTWHLTQLAEDSQELIKELPEHAFEKEKAEVVFFVGCVASFFPMVQKIPANMAKIMQAADVDFTILGGEEWCCGFPLIGAGMPEKLEATKDHNLNKVAEVGGCKDDRVYLPVLLSYVAPFL